MKRRIFIAMHYMEIGGAESSLIGLLEALDPEKVDIDLFVFSHQGVFMSAIPEYVHLLPERADYSMLERPIAEVFRKGHLLVGIARLMAKWKINRFYRKHPSERDHSAGFSYMGVEVGRVLPNLYEYGEYDLAISYNYPHNLVLDKVKAKKKIAWLHTDYRHISVDEQLELPIWSAFDRIVSISPDVTTGFLETFPTLADKIMECENILPKGLILGRAEEGFEGFEKFEVFERYNGLKLLSIGRISNAKNYDNIPYMAAKLKELLAGMDAPAFRWFIVGPGDHSAIDALSENLGVKDNVIFLGPSSNPYPFLKYCDIYAHPSRYEGKSIVVREAQVLCKPVVITNYPTAHSQINDGVDGVIVPLDNEGCAKGLAEFIMDESKQKEIIKNLQKEDHAGMNEVNKIYELIDA